MHGTEAIRLSIISMLVDLQREEHIGTCSAEELVDTAQVLYEWVVPPEQKETGAVTQLRPVQ